MEYIMSYTFTCKHCNQEFQYKDKERTYCSKACYTAAQTGTPSNRLIENYVDCVQCGVSFRARPRANRQFCSHACHSVYQVGKPSNKPGSISHTCPECGVLFKDAQSVRRVYCSKACHNKSKEKVKADKLCECCGAHFQVYPSADDTRFCSASCRYAHNSGERNPKWRPSVTLTCEQCGGLFERKPWQSYLRFCSRPCRNHWLRNNIMSPTGIEIAIESVLSALGIAHEPQATLGQWSCDFLIPSISLVIECDGDYWHSLPRTRRKDIIKDQWLQENGYRVLHLSEADINNRLDECKERIKSALLYQELQ